MFLPHNFPVAVQSAELSEENNHVSAETKKLLRHRSSEAGSAQITGKVPIFFLLMLQLQG